MQIKKWRCVEALNDDEKAIFAANLKYLMTDTGMTQDEFANFLGISMRTLRTWLLGQALPQTVGKIDDIGKLFGITGKQLVSAEYRMHLDAVHGYVRTIEDIYPYNLLRDVFNNTSARDNKGNDTFDEDYLNLSPNKALSAISRLTPRQVMLLEFYYRDGLTMEEISIKSDVGRERVRQLITGARFNLRRIIAQDNNAEYAEHMKLVHVLEDAETKIKELEEIKGLNNLRTDEHDNIRSIPTINLGLPLRAYNALNMIGIHTVGDIIDYDCGPKRWSIIRNFGAACQSELYFAMKNLGYTINTNKLSAGGIANISEKEYPRPDTEEKQ